MRTQVDLSELLRNECIGLFAGDREHKASFGMAGRSETAMLLELCAPAVHYPRHGFLYQFLPPSFKALVSDPEGFDERFGCDTLYIFHHLFNIDRAAKRLRAIAASDQKGARTRDANATQAIRRSRYLHPLDDVNMRYPHPTCITMNTWQQTVFLGEQATNTRVMTQLKGAPEQAFDILKPYVPAPTIARERRAKRIVMLYDFFKRPVENTYILDALR